MPGITDSKNSQIFIYSSGLGTMDKIGKYSAGVFGDGFDESILQAYINLVSNYRPGDKIYIFGFSRGAVIARALTGFITHSGLLKANSTAHIEHAWNYFTHKKQKFDYASQIGSIAHQNVKIEFLGVWDTVSGPHKKDELLKRYRFTNRKLDPSIKHGVHIISVDETRRAFAPIAWSGCSDGEQVLEQSGCQVYTAILGADMKMPSCQLSAFSQWWTNWRNTVPSCPSTRSTLNRVYFLS